MRYKVLPRLVCLHFLTLFEFELSELYMIIDQTVVISVILMVKPLWYYMLFLVK